MTSQPSLNVLTTTRRRSRSSCFICWWGGKCFADSTPDFPVVNPSSLRELSHLTGLHRETLRRRMADAEDLGLIQRISGGYVVSDVERWLRAVRVFRQET